MAGVDNVAERLDEELKIAANTVHIHNFFSCFIMHKQHSDEKSSLWLFGKIATEISNILEHFDRQISDYHIVQSSDGEDVSGVETVKTFPSHWCSSTNTSNCDAHFPWMQFVCVGAQFSCNSS